MSLTTITTTLEADWTRRLRRNRPQDRWARTHPALGGNVEALRRQLADWRSEAGRARFAELVDLARLGDHAAAELVTLTVLPAITRYEQRCRQQHQRSPRTNSWLHDYRTLAGAVWEALLASTSFKPAHLHEDIVRQAWYITRSRTLSPYRELPASEHDDDRSARNPEQRGRAIGHTAEGGRVDDDVVSRVAVEKTLAKLVSSGTLSERGHDVLASIAADRGGQAYAREHRGRAFAQFRLRVVTALRDNHELLATLTG